MTDLLQTWASFYANHAAVRTLVAFVHVGALIGFLTTLGGVALPNIG